MNSENEIKQVKLLTVFKKSKHTMILPIENKCNLVVKYETGVVTASVTMLSYPLLLQNKENKSHSTGNHLIQHFTFHTEFYVPRWYEEISL